MKCYCESQHDERGVGQRDTEPQVKLKRSAIDHNPAGLLHWSFGRALRAVPPWCCCLRDGSRASSDQPYEADQPKITLNITIFIYKVSSGHYYLTSKHHYIGLFP